jgi:Rhodopirellula transposase DDE domain
VWKGGPKRPAYPHDLPLLASSLSVKGSWSAISFISSNWRGEPLRDYETVVKLIARTTTAKGLTVTCRLDRRKYATGRTVTKADLQHVNLHPQPFVRVRNHNKDVTTLC